MIPLKNLDDEYIYQPKLAKQKTQLILVPLPTRSSEQLN